MKLVWAVGAFLLVASCYCLAGAESLQNEQSLAELERYLALPVGKYVGAQVGAAGVVTTDAPEPIVTTPATGGGGDGKFSIISLLLGMIKAPPLAILGLVSLVLKGITSIVGGIQNVVTSISNMINGI